MFDTRSVGLVLLLSLCSVLALLSGLLVLTSQTREGQARNVPIVSAPVVWVCVLFLFWLLLQSVDLLGLWSMAVL